MAIIDRYKSDPSGVFKSQQQNLEKKYTLTDLRNDDEFVKRTERFLESLEEGESVADLYQYFRGADWNIVDTGKVALQAKDFTDEQVIEILEGMI